MKKCVIITMLIFTIHLMLIAQTPETQKDIQFTPAEVESMLFLYNQTQVKGAEVELVAPVGSLLNGTG